MRYLPCLWLVLALTSCSLGINFDEIEGCSGELVFDGEGCVCPEGSVLVTGTQDSCGCAENFTAYEEEPFCRCEAPFIEGTDADGRATCGCPEGFVAEAGACVCPGIQTEEGGICTCPPTYSAYDEAPLCRCDPPLVEQTLPSGETACGCPVELTAEGGVFEVPGTTPLSCAGRVDVLPERIGDPSRTLSDISVLQVEDATWRVALLEETSLRFVVQLHEVTLAADGSANLNAIGPGVDIARPEDLDSSVVSGSGAVGIELLELDGVTMPIVVLNDSSVLWVDYQDESAPVLREVTSTSSVDESVALTFDDAYRITLFQRWMSPGRDAASLIFNGTFAERGFAAAAGVRNQVIGFAELSLDTASRELSLAFGHTELEGVPESNYLSLTQWIIGAVVFLSLDPLSDNPDVFFATGVSGQIYVGDDTEEGCQLLNGCTRFRNVAPALYEIEYAPSLQRISARAGNDAAVAGSYANLLETVTEPFVTSFVGEGSRSLDKFAFAGFSSSGRSLDVVSIGLPIFTGCYIDDVLRDCDAQNSAAEPAELNELPIPTYKPILMTFWERGASLLRANSFVSLEDRLSGAVTAADNAILGAPVDQRLFFSLGYDIDTERRSIQLLDVDVQEERVSELVSLDLGPYASLPGTLPLFVASGLLVLTPTSDGVLVAVFGQTP